MGMYDNLIINTNKLPVSDEEKIRIGENPGWQTKDFDCDLTEIYITDDGELKINRWKYDWVPEEERPYPKDEGIKGMIGCLKRVGEHLETINHHGYVNFYSNIGTDWYEFYAKFTDGKLSTIEGGKKDDTS